MTGYVLCASPRSGSTLLCDLLARTRKAGKPQSYFRPAAIQPNAREWSVTVDEPPWDRGYVDAVRRHGNADTGRFAMRIMWSDMPAFLEQLGELYPRDRDDRTRLRSAFGITAFVHLSRSDRVAQAVSLALAEQTGLWHRNADGSERQRSGPACTPTYDHGQIAALVDMLDTEAQGWSTWFATTGVTPLQVTYEDLARSPLAQLARVLGHLSIDVDTLPAVGTAQLSNELNDEWIARFREVG